MSSSLRKVLRGVWLDESLQFSDVCMDALGGSAEHEADVLFAASHLLHSCFAYFSFRFETAISSRTPPMTLITRHVYQETRARLLRYRPVPLGPPWPPL